MFARASRLKHAVSAPRRCARWWISATRHATAYLPAARYARTLHAGLMILMNMISLVYGQAAFTYHSLSGRRAVTRSTSRLRAHNALALVVLLERGNAAAVNDVSVIYCVSSVRMIMSGKLIAALRRAYPSGAPSLRGGARVVPCCCGEDGATPPVGASLRAHHRAHSA